MPLIEATTDAAISAATNDPRFSPIRPEELKEVVFEVSVLTPPVLLRPKSPSEYPLLIKSAVTVLWSSGATTRGFCCLRCL
ncbi:MAG TPA: AMMECR1 domain-containing protein, partial [Candidatus Methanomethylicus sp.]|nr:AMMECR1 domain-containing protein [Candidatus Methanomethylicus sp.]